MLNFNRHYFFEGCKVRRLKKTSVPSVNLPTLSTDTSLDSSKVKQNSLRLKRLQDRTTKKEHNLNNIGQDIYDDNFNFSDFSKLNEDTVQLTNMENRIEIRIF